MIIAIGGGSAIDVAKCIKLYSNLDSKTNYLEQPIIPNDIPFIVIPTTAGTGSESTEFAVIYYKGKKQSIKDKSIIPNVIVFDSTLLNTLPLYQKKVTVLDAFSHAIEAMWSLNSNLDSIEYAKEALKLIINNMYIYFNESNQHVNDKMFEAANLAGKAINISQTTAGHAMCYKLSMLYNISHGHAAALINSELLPYMIKNIDKCIDERGKDYLYKIFEELMIVFKCENMESLNEYIRQLLTDLDLYSLNVNYGDIDVLVKSVNPTRMKNNPIELNSDDIKKIYTSLFNEIEKRKNEDK